MTTESMFENAVASLVLGDNPTAKLMALSEYSALLYMQDKTYVVFYRYVPGADERMGDHMLKVASSVTSGTLYMVLVGGSDRQKELLSGAQVGWGVGRTVRVMHLNDDGEIWLGQRISKEQPLVRAIESRVSSPHDDQYKKLLEVVDPNADGSREMADFVQQIKKVKPVVTWTLTGLCVLIYGLATMWGGSEYVPSMVRMGANLPMLTRTGEFERLASSIFLHAGLPHLGMNMLGLWVLGAFLERILGSWRILLLFCISGIAGSVSSAWLGSAELSVGASGALWGLLASSAVIAFIPSAPLPATLVARLKHSALTILAINLMISFLPRIDIWAHLGGGMAGAALTALPVFFPKNKQQEKGKMHNPGWLIGMAIFFALLLIAGTTTSLLKGKAWQLVQKPSYQRVSIEKDRISIEIPSIIVHRRQDHKGVDSMESAFGDLGMDPLMVDVSTKSGYGISSSSGQDIEQLKKARQGQGIAGAERQGSVTIRDMGTVPTVVELFTYPSGVKYWRFSQLRSKMVVTITVLNWPQGPSQWAQCNNRIVASLQTPGEND